MNAQIDQTFDPYAPRETRRLELIHAASEKEQALKARISATKQRALELRADAEKLARNYHQKQADALRTEAAQLEDIAKTLNTVDLPKLRVDAENIRMGRHPELSRLALIAEGRIRSNQEDQKRAACNALTAAKSALYEHLEKLATPETLRLAQAVAEAERAADVEQGEATRALITMLGPKAAA